eukprot:1149164-Pelagomonas_calceolata.AAC.1
MSSPLCSLTVSMQSLLGNRQGGDGQGLLVVKICDDVPLMQWVLPGNVQTNDALPVVPPCWEHMPAKNEFSNLVLCLWCASCRRQFLVDREPDKLGKI